VASVSGCEFVNFGLLESKCDQNFNSKDAKGNMKREKFTNQILISYQIKFYPDCTDDVHSKQ
jgi:hypothetical protein